VIPAPHLVREIRRWDLVGLGINFTVGAGIFGLPSTIYRLAGVGSPLTYVACALAIMPIVLCYAEVGSRFEQTGGPYLYAGVRSRLAPLDVQHRLGVREYEPARRLRQLRRARTGYGQWARRADFRHDRRSHRGQRYRRAR
jgi:hypothetical protein